MKLTRCGLSAGAARFVLGAFALSFALTGSGRAQCVLHSFEGSGDFDFLGMSVDGGGDVDADGRPDVIVGALGYTLGGRAEIHSGRTGLLLHVLPAPGFMSCALAGDVDGDGHVDAVVGFSDHAAPDKVRVFSGATGAVLHTFQSNLTGDGFGASVAGVGDVDGDGHADVIVGAPQTSTANPGSGYARVFSGRTGVLLHEFTGSAVGDNFGYSVNGAGDVDADGFADLILGAWRNDLGGADAGLAQVRSGATGLVLHQVVGAKAQDWLGQSVSGAGDVNADGHSDFLVGIPGSDVGGSQGGSASIYSGVDGTRLFTFHGTFLANQLGTAVAAAGDVNGDQVPDVVIGNGGGQSTARVFSGADGSLMLSVAAINVAAVASAGDVDGDGLAEFLVGDPIANAPEVGQATIYAGPGAGPLIYCTAKMNSQGCTPAIGWTGAPSSSSARPFTIEAALVLNNKNGILFYGTSGSAALPFQGGTLCAALPVVRTPAQPSGGNPPPDDCSGSFSFDFNAWMQGDNDPQLGPGVRVSAQYWYRDPAASFTTGLTDALEFTICE